MVYIHITLLFKMSLQESVDLEKRKQLISGLDHISIGLRRNPTASVPSVMETAVSMLADAVSSLTVARVHDYGTADTVYSEGSQLRVRYQTSNSSSTVNPHSRMEFNLSVDPEPVRKGALDKSAYDAKFSSSKSMPLYQQRQAPVVVWFLFF